MYNKIVVLYKKSYINYTFYLLMLIIILLKIWMLAIPNHPFDFWTFINRSQRFVLYGISIFEQDNKGILISTLYLFTYLSYEVTRSLLSMVETHNLIFLNLFSKLPFLLIEVFTGIVIYKTALYFKISKDNAKKIFVLYFINPINFYIYGIHGHYETIVPFALSIFIYLHIIKKYNISAIFLAIAFSIKYIPIIYIPIAVFYIIINSPPKWLHKSMQFLISFSLTSFILFSNIFFTIGGGKTIQNAINLSNSSGASVPGSTIHTLNPLSWVSSMVYIFQNEYVTNLSHPTLFLIANKGIYISLTLIFIFIFYRMLVIIRSNNYTPQEFINDILILTIILFINLSNFQGHYISWIVTLIYLNISFLKYNRPNLYLMFIASTFYLYASEEGILTTYSLVNIKENVNFFSDRSFSKITGSVIIVSLLILLVNLIIKNNQKYKIYMQEIFNKIIYILLVLWLPLVTVSILATKEYINLIQNQPKKLTFSKRYSNIEGIYFDIFNLKDEITSKNKYLFHNTGIINTNIIEISKNNPDRYKTMFLIKDIINKNYDNFKLNECYPKQILYKNNDNEYLITGIKEKLYIPSGTFIIILYDNNCVNNKDNYLNISNDGNMYYIDTSKIRLMISNY